MDFSEPKRRSGETESDSRASTKERAAPERRPDRVAPVRRSDPAYVRGAQRFTDELIRRTLLWLFPRWVRPNHLTFFRFVLIPVVLVLLYYQLPWWAFGVFLVAVSTDFIDGAMARTRDQITPLGTIIDPIADKVLVAAVLAWVGYQYLVVQVILAFIALELILTAVGIGIARPGQRARQANYFGKAKMVVQSIALILFLIAAILGLEAVLSVSLYLLWVAIALGALSGLKHVLEVGAARRRTDEEGC